MQMAIFPHGIYKYSVEDSDAASEELIQIYNNKRFESGYNHISDSEKLFSTFGNDDLPTVDLITNFYCDVISEFSKEVGLQGEVTVDDMWMNVYEKNCFKGNHTHAPSQWSLCHFILFDPKLHKSLCFHNPSRVILGSNYPYGVDTQVNRYWFAEYVPYIEQGDVLIFPSYLEHSVPLNTSNQLKATVSFNFRIDQNAARDIDTEESPA